MFSFCLAAFDLITDWRDAAVFGGRIETEGKMGMISAMVVDDAEFIRKVIREMLEDAGVDVVAEARNGKEAVEIYKKFGPDLVFMDMAMPVMDGIAALKEIKRFDPAAKVIICSAMDGRDLIREAMDNGASDYVMKPFLKERVEEAVRKVLG